MVKPVLKAKDRDQAKQRREEGNTAFQKKWYKQALVMYSMSIVKGRRKSKVTDLQEKKGGG